MNSASPHEAGQADARQIARHAAQQAEKIGRIAVTLIRETFKAWNRDNAQQLGAALAFYTALSLAPLLVLLIVIAGQLLGDAAARNEIQAATQNVIGADAASVVESVIQNASTSGSSVVATVISFVMLMVGASGVFVQLRKALNIVWALAPKPERGLLGMLRDRLISFIMVLAAGSLLIAFLALDTVAGALNEAFGPLLTGLPSFSRFVQILQTLQTVKLLVSFAVFALLFALIYKALPAATIAWRDAWIGAGVTSLLFTLGNFLVGFYLRRSTVGSAYGAAGSLVALLVWVYFSALVFFFGAEFTQVYANYYGSRIVPDPDAVRIVRQRRSEQEVSNLLKPRFSPTTPPQRTSARHAPAARERPQSTLRKAARYGGLIAAALSLVVGALIGYQRLKGDR